MANSSINLHQPLSLSLSLCVFELGKAREVEKGRATEENQTERNGEINFWLDFQSGLNSPPLPSHAAFARSTTRNRISVSRSPPS